MVDALWMVTLELAPWLLLGAFIAGVLHIALPDGFVARQLSGRFGVLKAVAFGVPLPLCSCGVIPAGLGLKRDGASDGAAVGFLISTPQTGVDSILVSAGLLGWPFALWKVAAAFATGLAGGWLADRGAHGSAAAAVTVTTPVRARKRDAATLAAHAIDILRTIAGWLVFGIVASAALTVLVPPDAFAALTGAGGLVGIGAALLISIPLYVCATASVPIAAALVAAGMPIGAALVFLMAGPATNVATLGAVKGAFGGRILSIYLGVILVGSVAFAMAFEAVAPGGGLIVAPGAHDHGGAWWEIASGVALVVLLAWFAVEAARSWLRARRVAALPARRTQHLDVDGMTCGGCAKKVERILCAVDGVDGATVDHEAGGAAVLGTADADTLTRTLADAGYPAVSRAS